MRARLLALVALAACGSEGADSLLGRGQRPGAEEVPGTTNPDEPPGVVAGTDDQLIGASADGVTHIISDGWADAPVRFGDNVKMLNFAQMEAEVERATGVTTIDWASKQAVFGGADFVATFQDDRTPSGTKMVAFRKIAFEACEAMMTKESATPSLFSAIPPKTAIDAGDAKVVEQVKLVFKRVFLEDAEAADVDLSTKALVDLVAAGATPTQAWEGLCVGYLSSMRFLSY